jgi:hypothetical protein
MNIEVDKDKATELITSWKDTADEMEKLAINDPNNAVMWRAAASVWRQAARELEVKFQLHI